MIEALLNITDSRFQRDLIEQAQKAGKLPKDFQLDPRFADNTPERLQAIQAKHRRLFPEYPLGSDFTDEERDLLRALNWLKSKFKLTEILSWARRHSTRRSRRPFPSICSACAWISRRASRKTCINACCWRACRPPRIKIQRKTKCGSGLAREGGGSVMNISTDTAHSRASPLHVYPCSGRRYSIKVTTPPASDFTRASDSTR